jgi:hypothetical protein
MHPHTVDGSFLYGELPHHLRVMIFEVKIDITLGALGTDQLDIQDLDLCGLVFFQSVLLDISEKGLFIRLERFIIFILSDDCCTKQSMSARLTLKFSTLVLVLEGNYVRPNLPDPYQYP